MNMERYPIEGDFLKSVDGNYFEIKGFDQPIPQEEMVIAFIRYIKSQDSGGSYEKIYSLSEKFEIAREKLKNIIYKSENYYFPLQALRLDYIEEHLRPEGFLQNLQSNPEILEKDEIIKDCYDFCKILSDNSGVDLKYLGITGSVLLGLQNPGSDIDIIVYGYGNSLKIREYIHQAFKINPNNKGGNDRVLRYNKKELKDLYHFRAKNSTISFFQFLKYEIRKFHQGKFRGRDFFIRFLEYPSREEYQLKNTFHHQKIKSLGRITIRGEVRDDKYWWTTPARVGITNLTILDKSELNEDHAAELRIYNLNLRDIVRTYTLRGKFTENIRLLESFTAHGTLELIIPKKNPPFLQLSLGSRDDDYLIQS